jgi:hypothetical protein
MGFSPSSSPLLRGYESRFTDSLGVAKRLTNQMNVA